MAVHLTFEFETSFLFLSKSPFELGPCEDDFLHLLKKRHTSISRVLVHFCTDYFTRDITLVQNKTGPQMQYRFLNYERKPKIENKMATLRKPKIENKMATLRNHSSYS